jgi:hypothetical protein
MMARGGEGVGDEAVVDLFCAYVSVVVVIYPDQRPGMQIPCYSSLFRTLYLLTSKSLNIPSHGFSFSLMRFLGSIVLKTILFPQIAIS